MCWKEGGNWATGVQVKCGLGGELMERRKEQKEKRFKG